MKLNVGGGTGEGVVLGVGEAGGEGGEGGQITGVMMCDVWRGGKAERRVRCGVI